MRKSEVSHAQERTIKYSAFFITDCPAIAYTTAFRPTSAGAPCPFAFTFLL